MSNTAVKNADEIDRYENKNVLHWFRNDLRFHDHEILSNVSNASSFTGIYILDERLFRDTKFGFPKMGAIRTMFLLETVSDLKRQLNLINNSLFVIKGIPEKIIPELVNKYAFDVLTFQKEHTDEEIKIERKVLNHLKNFQVQTFSSLTLIHEDDIPFDLQNTPKVFTSFRKKAEKKLTIREIFATPANLPQPLKIELSDKIPSLENLGFENSDVESRIEVYGGESNALKRLQFYTWESDLIKNYKKTRNGLLGLNFSSKFSPWLSNGSISPRKIYFEIKQYEKERYKNSSTYWLIFEMLWRDFFRFNAIMHGNKFFKKGGIREKNIKFSNSKELYDSWRNGSTGNEFVDANMIELFKTGYMSNRGRQNVASYLVNDLDIDWRWGAAWFESKLIDYDVCSNYGNWMYVAGVGNDPVENRYFNTQKQAERYDPDNEYINFWLQKPEKNLKLF